MASRAIMAIESDKRANGRVHWFTIAVAATIPQIGHYRRLIP